MAPHCCEPGTRRHAVPLVRLVILSVLMLVARPVGVLGQAERAPQPDGTWPRRVLLTNDDGIESPALRALARALAEAGIQTYVAAPSRDQSGTGSLMASLLSDSVVTQREDLGPGIEAWAVNAFPADCVLFALRGPMFGNPPDLVVSGPNAGGNVGEAWFISGTIGAARAAALFGVPAVAISGANVHDSLSVATIARWVVRFVQSQPVRRLRPPEYLNVNVPIDPRSVRGVAITTRARILQLRVLRDTSSSGEMLMQRWRLVGRMSSAAAAPGTDAFAVDRDSISIQALRVGEDDPTMAAWLAAHLKLVPPWPIADTTGRGKSFPRPH
jgi:5'/3'-nucleotidase